MEELIGSSLEWCVSARTFPGESTSGDRGLVQEHASGALLAVVDGLGHGHEAAAVAELALRALRSRADAPVVHLVNRCHEALRGSRGVTMSLASFSARDRTVTWLGVGDVSGLVLRGDAGNGFSRLLLRGGMVGVRLPPLQVSTLPVRSGDTLIFTTDGVAGDFEGDLDPKLPVRALADAIIEHHGRTTDDALVLIARFLNGLT